MILIGCCGLLITPHLRAESPPARYELILLAEHQALSETRNGHTLVEERGNLPSLTGRISLPMPHGALHLALSASSGELDYDGQTQRGAGFTSTTRLRTLRHAVSYVYPLQDGLNVLVGWLEEKRNRRISGRGAVLGLDEDYRHDYGTLGIRRDASWGSIQAELLLGLGGSQSVSSRGAVDTVTFPSNSGSGLHLQGRFPVTGHTHALRLEWLPRFEYLHTPRSDSRPYNNGGMPAGTISQPETRRWSAGLGLALSW
ncbi:hypothetical protein [Zoogloea dura]|uniref:Autotransporter outer membrane beta-barrel domain-containing protein n=1 Tax=Zoogloea dura TaxID=2728840 RepID=A0A848G6G7_9RHOO|nr:hypothetical protein [Zoogloea dura]NML27848.1 hypothetical protein [Zoogloea dura]